MQWRLPHVVVLMTLILAAGVLSVQGLEAYVGAASVPAAIVVDVADMQPGSLPWLAGGRDVPAWFAVEAADEPLAPFDVAFARRAAAGGSSTLLFSTVPLADEPAVRAAWGVVIAPAPSVADDAPGATDEHVAAQRLAAYVVEQRGTRPFLAGLQLGAQHGAPVARVLEPLLDAAASLPSYRRTSIVLLGARLPDGGRRVAIRFDVGRWAGRVRPALADLLEDIP